MAERRRDATACLEMLLSCKSLPLIAVVFLVAVKNVKFCMIISNIKIFFSR